ncbi:MAG: YecA family protein [Spirochaetales bacterium]|nr:YecA family protein [Spirochaetales bacterium]
MDIIAMETLEQWLGRFHEPEFRLPYWHGFICAVVCAPQVIPPSLWMDVILHLKDNDEQYEFKTHRDAEEKTGLLLRLYNELNNDIQSGNFKPYAGGDEDGMENWAEGFNLGMVIWDKEMLQQNKDRLTNILGPVGFFKLTKENLIKQLEMDKDTFDKTAKQQMRLLKKSIPEIRRLWNMLE